MQQGNRKKLNNKNIDGILVLDKPKGISSNKAIQICKNLFNAKKVGHAGTLDPMASGVLLVLFGEACKFASYGLQAKKSYRAKVKFGESTTTGDAEGKFLESKSVRDFTLAQIAEKLAIFRGRSMQVPPIYSALKHGGKKLYELALAGIAVEKPAREIYLYNLEFLHYENFELEFTAEVSKGTYIRKLAEDFALELDTLGHLIELRRLSSGKINLDMAKAVDLRELETKKRLGVYIEGFLYPPDYLLDELELFSLTQEQMRDIICGRQIKLTKNLAFNLKIGDNVRLYFSDKFLGLGEVIDGDILVAKRLLNTELLL